MVIYLFQVSPNDSNISEQQSVGLPFLCSEKLARGSNLPTFPWLY